MKGTAWNKNKNNSNKVVVVDTALAALLQVFEIKCEILIIERCVCMSNTNKEILANFTIG